MNQPRGYGHTTRATPGVSLPSGSRTRNLRILDPEYKPLRCSGDNSPFTGGHATQASKFVFSAIPQDSGDSDTQQDRADWSDRDWDDYNYALPAGGAGCGQSAAMRDPLDLKLEISLHYCVIFQYQYRVMSQE